VPLQTVEPRRDAPLGGSIKTAPEFLRGANSNSSFLGPETSCALLVTIGRIIHSTSFPHIQKRASRQISAARAANAIFCFGGLGPLDERCNRNSPFKASGASQAIECVTKITYVSQNPMMNPGHSGFTFRHAAVPEIAAVARPGFLSTANSRGSPLRKRNFVGLRAEW
jgi:hypothetical protein